LFALAARLDQGFSHPAFELGKLAWEKDDFRSAIQWFQKVKPVDAHRREATFLLGLSKFYTGDYAGAEAAFATVAREVPLNEVLNNLGAAQSRRDSPDALANFLKALEGDAGDPDYHFNLGYAMWKQGKYEAAADSFRAVLDRDPEDSEAIAMLGKSLKKSPYQRAGEPLERVKETYKESVYLQLKQALEPRPAGAQ
jgi:tetratricopeptide (TPR) repeat protein